MSKSTNLFGISFPECVRIIYSELGVFLEKKNRAREERHRVGKVTLYELLVVLNGINLAWDQVFKDEIIKSDSKIFWCLFLLPPNAFIRTR